MSYRNAIDYLESKTKVLELCNDFGARIAVCPDWNGRVMTSTADGIDGDSYGLVNVMQIEERLKAQGHVMPHQLIGGEDQLVLSPEGGPFSLFYDYDSEASAIHRHHIEPPIGYTEGPFEIDTVPREPEMRLRRNVRMQNLAGARFDIDLIRSIRLHSENDMARLFDPVILAALEQPAISYVSYRTVNTLVNRGATFSKYSGLLSLRVRGMYNSTPYHVLVIPFKPGHEEQLGKRFSADFFGTAPHGRLRLMPESLLLRTDGRFRCQIGVSRARAVSRVAAIDFRNGVFSIMEFNLPEDADSCDYLCNDYCETNEGAEADFVATRERYLLENGAGNPYAGEVVRAYGNGLSDTDGDTHSSYYEFDTFSPAVELQKNESITHIQHTTHIHADRATLVFLLDALFQIDFDTVYHRMLS